MSAADSNAIVGAFYIWPQFGKNLSEQWDKIRTNFENLHPLAKAMQLALDAAENHEPKNNDLSGLAHGERDFRNRWRIWYDPDNDRWALQFNKGTELQPQWEDYLTVRDIDGRVTVHQFGGLDSSVGGFYSPLPRNLAVSATFTPPSFEWVFNHQLNTKPILWDAYNLEDKSVIPLTVDVSDPNTAYFYFSVPQAGRAIAVAEAARGEGIRVTDGVNVFDGATRLDFNGQDFYLSNDGFGKPVVNLKPIDINSFDTSSLIHADGSIAFSADQSMGGHKLTNLGTPTNPTDAATKSYVDTNLVDVTLSNVGAPFFTNATKITFRQEDFYLDTDSGGQPVVNIRGGTGGGSSGQFGTGIFAQSFSSSVQWTLNHNLGVNNILWNVYDDQGNAIIPEKVSVHNPNVAYFYFSPATAGQAVVGGGPVFQSASSSLHIQESDGTPDYPAATKLTFSSTDFYIESDTGSNPIVNFRGSTSAGVTDHGALTGLLDDDHPQYLRTDGTRKYTGMQVGSIHVERVVVADAFYLTPGSGGDFSKQGNDVVISSKDGGVQLVPNPVGNIELVVGTLNDGGTAGTIDIFAGNSPTGRAGSVNIGPGTGSSPGSVFIGNGLANGSEVEIFDPMDLQNNQIHSVADPTSAQDAATKNYVDVKLQHFYSNFGTGTGLQNVVEDLTPQLGGDLDTNGFNITSAANPINIRSPRNVNIVSGTLGDGNGDVEITTDNTFYPGASAGLIVIAGGASDSGNGGTITIDGGPAVSTGAGGDIILLGGDSNSGPGGNISISAGSTVSGTPASITIGTGGADGRTILLADPISAGTNIISDVVDPVLPQDAATKNYVDTHTSGGGGGFYGIVWSDGTRTLRTDRLSFNGSEFYLDGRKPTVNLKESGIDHNLLANLTVGDPHTQYIRVDGTRAFTGAQSHGGFRITNLGAPTAGSDAARLQDVGPGFYGLEVKQAGTPATAFRGLNILKFPATQFYLTQNAGDTDSVIINLRKNGIASLAEDPSPMLTANLNANGFTITNAPNITGASAITAPGTFALTSSGDMNITAVNTQIQLSGTANSSFTMARSLNVFGADFSSGAIDGGFVLLRGGGISGAATGNAGSVFLTAGNASVGTGNGGDVQLTAGTSAGGAGGKIKILGPATVSKDLRVTHTVEAEAFYLRSGGQLTQGIATISDGVSSYANPTALSFSNLDFYISRGTGGNPSVNLRQSLEPLSAYLDFASVGNTFLETWSEHIQIIEDISLVCRAGSATVGFYIVPAAHPDFRDGTRVSGADPITVSSTPFQTVPTANRTLNPGDGLKMALYINGNAKGVRVKVRLRRQ